MKLLGSRKNIDPNLDLRAGDLVEVRSKEEILSTLDENGRLEALPFMPEMLKYCGKQFKVFKNAHKTCDTIENKGGRRMRYSVHLEGLRCDGQAHAGCQAGCLIFWKEAWLKRVSTAGMAVTVGTGKKHSGCNEGNLWEATRVLSESQEAQAERFRCQATELLRATSPLVWWDLRQYWRDIRFRNVGIMEVIQALLFRIFTKLLKIGAYRAQIWTYNLLQQMCGGIPYPLVQGKLLSKTPSQILNLQPGELVQVKSRNEIFETINLRNRNRGLSFDVEMVKYCGGKFRVLQRVDRIVDEKTGRLMQMPNDCSTILEGVTCQADFSHKRLFCPRSIYPYWREIWVKRIE